MLDVLILNSWLLAALWALMYIFDYASTLWLARAYQTTLSKYVVFEHGVELNPNFEREIAGRRWFSPKFVLLLALSPALVFVNALVAPPYSSPQKLSRTLAGPLTAGVVLFMWFCSSGYRTRLPLLGILKRRPAAGRLLALASALLVATMPWDIMLTLLYARYLEVVRSTIRAHGGLIEMESSILELHPRLAHDDSAATAVSLIMRTSPSDGLIVWSERDRGVFLDFDPKSLPDLGRFVWRD